MSPFQAREAVTSIIQALNTSQVYPQDHPRVQEKISSAAELLEDIFDRENKLVLGLDEGKLVIQDTPVDQSDEFLQEFKRLIEERNLGSLVLNNGLTRSELQDLLWILRKGTDEILEDHEIREDLVSTFDHVQFNSVSIQISENERKTSSGSNEPDSIGDESNGSEHQSSSPYEVLVEQLDDLLDEVDTDQFLSDLPDDLKEKLKSSFAKLGFNVLTNVLNQLVEHSEHNDVALSGESTQKIFNRFLQKMTEEKQVNYSEFKKGLDDALTSMEGNARETLIDEQDLPKSAPHSSQLLSHLNPEVRGNVIGNELREGDPANVRHAVEQLSGTGEDLLSISETVADGMDVTVEEDTSDLTMYFESLFDDVSFPEEQGRVAFVDDSDEFRKTFSTVLEKMGFQVDEFEHGRGAWDFIVDEGHLDSYDLLVMDVELPEKNGLDLLKEFGAMRMDLPVIVATNETEFRNSFEVLTHPAIEFHAKPVSPEDFVRSVVGQVQSAANQIPGDQESEAEERRKAREIQEKLINQEFPDPGSFRVESYYEPSRYVGGDFLDYFPLSKSRSLFMIGDVSGSGVPAAMIMVMVRSILRMCFGQMTSPEKALKRANQLITRDIQEGMYVSLAVCAVDSDEETVTLLNAGQRTPIVLRDQEGQSEVLLSDGIAIGLGEKQMFESSLQPKSLDLTALDTIVFYTEGVSEAINQEDEIFGVSRLLSIASEHGGSSPETIMKEIIKGVKTFQGDEPQQKDSTLLAIQYDPF